MPLLWLQVPIILSATVRAGMYCAYPTLRKAGASICISRRRSHTRRYDQQHDDTGRRSCGILEKPRCLGQPYQIRGIVGPGRRRGRHLGFPTANLQLQFPYCLPPDGVYFTWITIDDTRHPSLTNIGNNPTFEGAERKIETYVMDFSGDLYDREVRLDFVEYFRPDMRFDNKEELIAQMQRDENEARRLLIEMSLHKRI